MWYKRYIQWSNVAYSKWNVLCDNDGNLTSTMTNIRIGVALSTTELLMDKGFGKGR